MSARRSRTFWLWLAAAAVLAAALAAGAAYFLWRPAADPDLDDRPSGTASEWVAAKNRAVAQLENAEYNDAEAAFVALSKPLGREPLVFRNLTIARLLQLEALRERGATADEPVSAGLARDARDALERLRAIEGLDSETDAVAAHWLAARAARAAGKPAAAAAQLRAGLAADPNAAELWYELYRLSSDSEDPDEQATARAAVDRLFALQPDNLFVLVEWARQKAAQIRSATGAGRR